MLENHINVHDHIKWRKKKNGKRRKLAEFSLHFRVFLCVFPVGNSFRVSRQSSGCTLEGI